MLDLDYEEFQKEAEESLTKIKVRGFKMIEAMLTAEHYDNIYGADIYFAGLVDKSSFLINGLKYCIKEKNIIVLGLLVRTQIDNCLRAFALTLVDDPHDLVLKVLSGKELRNIGDRDGNKMTDRYLVEKLSRIDSKVKQVYKAACGYIHFSDKGMLHSLSVLKSSKLGISVGKISDKDDVYIKEGYLAFLHFTNILYEKELIGWIIKKSKTN